MKQTKEEVLKTLENIRKSLERPQPNEVNIELVKAEISCLSILYQCDFQDKASGLRHAGGSFFSEPKTQEVN